MNELLINNDSIPLLVEDSQEEVKWWDPPLLIDRILYGRTYTLKTITPNVPDLERTSYLGE